MKKEYKDFYRFLWEYLENGNSAIIIKSRNVGMTSFAARYAAWCLDYKDVGVHLHMCRKQNLEHMHQLIDGARCFNPYVKRRDLVNNLGRVIPCEDAKLLHIFDEIDFIENIEKKLLGYSVNQFLAYSSIGNFRNFNRFYESIQHCYRNDKKEFRVFNISDHNENKWRYYPEK